MTEADTDISSLIKFNRHAETLGKVFDVVKKSANGVDYVILGLENQSKIHYAMPLRHMIGDAFSYLKEYKELEAKNKKYKNYKTKHEFLSKFQKTDRLHPIVTICIYYGEDEWDGPRSLIDMLDIPEEFESLKLEQEGVELNMCKALVYHIIFLLSIFRQKLTFQTISVMLKIIRRKRKDRRKSRGCN